MSIIKGMLEEDPDILTRSYSFSSELAIEECCNGLHSTYRFARAAVDKLESPEEIRQFYRELVEVARKEGNYDSNEVAGKWVDSALGYCMGYEDSETQRLWFDTLHTISHPVYGRDPSMGITSEIIEYYIVPNTKDKRVVRKVFRDLKEKLDTEPHTFPTFHVYALESLTQDSYPTFGLKLKHMGIFDPTWDAKRRRDKRRIKIGKTGKRRYILKSFRKMYQRCKYEIHENGRSASRACSGHADCLCAE